ncbi:MAG: hypothetical protein FWH55_12015 [Oscillospiraceae bacterium]|nr:hypothetical protein [Oscillospiraceae bacterium]
MRSLAGSGSFAKEEALAKLSALVEVGRFYFPNKLEKHLSREAEKDSAYQGHRDVALDYLVFTYVICKSGEDIEHVDHLRKLSRLFTSRVFDALNPREHNRRLKMSSFIRLSNADTITLADIFDKSAEAAEVYLASLEITGQHKKDWNR